MKKWSENILYPFYFFVLMFVSFLTVWGYGTQRVIVPVQMKTIGTDIFMMGVFLSLFGLPRAAMNVVGGHLSDRFSKKNNIIVSVFLFGVFSTFFIGISESSFGIGLWRILMAIGLSWATTAMVAYLAELTTSAIRGTVFGIQKMAMWIGMALAGLVAPVLLGYIAIEILMSVMALLSVAAIFLVYFFLSDVKGMGRSFHTVKKNGPVKRLAVEKGNTDVSLGQKVILACDGCLIKIVEDGLITFFLPIYILIHYDQLVAIGLVISIFTVVYAFSQPLGGLLADHFGSWKVVALGLVSMLLSVIVLSLSSGLINIYMVSAIAGFGSGVAVTSAEMKASFMGDEATRARTLGYWRFYRDLGSTVGPLLTGALYGFGHERFFLYLLMVLIAVSVIFTAVFNVGRSEINNSDLN